MHPFIIGFELKSDASYTDRYNSLTTVIEMLGDFWSDPTSFYLMTSKLDLGQMANRLTKTLFDPKKDLLFIYDMWARKYIIVGAQRSQLPASLRVFAQRALVA